MTISTWKVYIAQVHLHTCRVHVRAVPVSLKIYTSLILLYVYLVSVLLKIRWRCINNCPDSGVYITQVHPHTRRVRVCTVLVLLKIWYHNPLALWTYWWAQRSEHWEVIVSEAQSQRVMDLTKKGGKWEQGTWTCGNKGNSNRGRWDAKRKDPAPTVRT